MSAHDTAAIEITQYGTRILVDDVSIVRPAVGTAMSDLGAPGAWYMYAANGGYARVKRIGHAADFVGSGRVKAYRQILGR